MLDELLDAPVLVLLGILDRLANLRVGQALPDHRSARRRQPPVRCAGRQVCANKIVVLMTGTAFLRSHAVTLQPTPDVHCVWMPVVTLTGKVSVRVTIHAARMPQHGNKGCEERSLIAGCSAGRTLLSRDSGLFCSGDCTRDPESSGEKPDQQRHLNELVRAHHTASARRIGSRRIRFPVTANTAFAIAGAAHGTPGSPMPPDFSLFSTIWVSICGDSLIRITGKV
jgi:hypothetical protein